MDTPTQLIYCWGFNGNDQLGDQTVNNAVVPVQAWYLVTVADVAVSITMDPELGLTISPVPITTSCGDVTTTVATTTNIVNLGHVSATTQHRIGGQTLNATTNALNGYSVYISYRPLRSFQRKNND